MAQATWTFHQGVHKIVFIFIYSLHWSPHSPVEAFLFLRRVKEKNMNFWFAACWNDGCASRSKEVNASSCEELVEALDKFLDSCKESPESFGVTHWTKDDEVDWEFMWDSSTSRASLVDSWSDIEGDLRSSLESFWKGEKAE